MLNTGSVVSIVTVDEIVAAGLASVYFKVITSLAATFNCGGLAVASDVVVASMFRRKMPVVAPVSVNVTVIPVGSAWETTFTAVPVSLASEPQ